jgi:MOSC domain-containing protein YiiM
MAGRLIGIAGRSSRRLRMQEIDAVEIAAGAGLEGDYKGTKFARRGVTVLAREDWERALAELADLGGPLVLPWTTRRANLLVENVRLPRARGAVLRIGSVLIEVTYPTQPCRRMDEAHQGLLRALHPDWRGGITAKVVTGGTVRLGDAVEIVSSPPERTISLPG